MSALYSGQQIHGIPLHSKPQPPETYQVVTDTMPRFFATPEEKKLYFRNQLHTVDFRTTYLDSFISVVVDGNRFQFIDGFVANDEAGGKQAAMAFTHAIGEMLGQMGYEVTRLVIRIFGNPEWLSDAYLDSAVIPHRVNFGWFLQGFNSVESLVEFVAISDGPCTPVYRMRDAAGLLKVNLLDPHCQLVLFGGTIDDKVSQMIMDNQSATTHGRLMLLETSCGAPSPLPMLTTLQRFSLPHVFRDTEHRPRINAPKSAIFRNAQGQRVDPSINPKETMVVWLRSQKFCNNHFLQGQCPEPRCKARHDGRLTSEQLDALRSLARSLPCRYSNQCRDPDCYAGHMCPFQPCANRNCKFYAEMHVIDRRIVSQDP